MPYWMTNAEHGVMPVYDLGEVERVKVHGWTLLNQGESPDRSRIGRKEAAAIVGDTEPTDAPAANVLIERLDLPPMEPRSDDILDAPVVIILPQLAGKSRAELEVIRHREATREKPRKGLLTALSEAIEAA